MNIHKQHITDYIKCPYLFAKNLLANKYTQSKLDGDYLKFKNYITEIASYEMKNNTKMELSEYRIGYTNRFFSSKKDVLNKKMDGIIPKLNNIFSSFSENIFLGYNVPVEIVIPGTANIYKDTIQYLMSDVDNARIIAIELDQLDDVSLTKKILKEWPHYYTVYSYLAHKFNKKVDVIVLDPITGDIVEAAYLPDRHLDDLKLLSEIIIPIEKSILYKNLFMCKDCELITCTKE